MEKEINESAISVLGWISKLRVEMIRLRVKIALKHLPVSLVSTLSLKNKDDHEIGTEHGIRHCQCCVFTGCKRWT